MMTSLPIPLWASWIPQAKAQDGFPETGGDTGYSLNTPEFEKTFEPSQITDTGTSVKNGTAVYFNDEIVAKQKLTDEILETFESPYNFSKDHLGQFSAILGALVFCGAVRHFANKYRAPLQDLLNNIHGRDKNELIQLKSRIDKAKGWERFLMFAAAIGVASSFEECRDFVSENRADVILASGGLTLAYALRRIIGTRKNTIITNLKEVEKELKAPISPDRKTELEALHKRLTTTKNFWSAGDVTLLGGIFVTALSKFGYMDSVLQWLADNDIKILGIALVAGGGLYIMREVNKSLTSLGTENTLGSEPQNTSPLTDFLLKGTRILVGGSVGAISLGICGVPVGQVINSLGLFSMAISFASKDMMSNWVAQQIVRIQQFIKEDEEISITGIRGKIVDINWQNTTILEETPHGTQIEQRIPNTDLLAKNVGKAAGDKALIEALKEGDYVIQKTATASIYGRVFKINKDRGTFILRRRDLDSPRPDAYVNTVLYLNDITPVSHFNFGAGQMPLDLEDPDLDIGDLIEVLEVKGIITKYDDDYVWLYPEVGEYVRLKRSDFRGTLTLIQRRKKDSDTKGAL